MITATALIIVNYHQSDEAAADGVEGLYVATVVDYRNGTTTGVREETITGKSLDDVMENVDLYFEGE
jgi:hypothetical protein